MRVYGALSWALERRAQAPHVWRTQFYLKRNLSSPPPLSPSESSTDLLKAVGISRSSSQNILSNRGSIRPVPVSSRATTIVRSSDSIYYIGLKKVLENPYHSSSNPEGIMQLGLADNKAPFCCLQRSILFREHRLNLGFFPAKSSSPWILSKTG
ncbi:putative aminotransferase ACS10 [Platanthera guangdongensis]|uniref:Aminotransferase ACS10 n=1 Tax=Platanthera guangdongensis TaxID=2320717 RepID=A0ABR2LXR6_9ASPA